VLSDNLTSSSSLNEVFQVFKRIECIQADSFKEEFKRHKKNLGNGINSCLLVKKLAEIFSPYVVKKLEPKISKSLSYSCMQQSSNTW